MSVSEFKYAVYPDKTWNECVELDDELFLIDEGEGLWLSILKYFYCYFCKCPSIVSILISLYCFFSLFKSLFITNFLQLFFQLFFSRIFKKMKVYPFHREKVDTLFVVVAGNCICHRCVFGAYYSFHSLGYQIDFLGWYY